MVVACDSAVCPVKIVAQIPAVMMGFIVRVFGQQAPQTLEGPGLQDILNPRPCTCHAATRII